MTVIDPPPREIFVDKATDVALSTSDAPRTPEAVERAWSARERPGRADRETNSLVLWNYDVGAAAPKREHISELDQFFFHARLGSGAHGHRYVVTGAASVTGAELTNETLSGRRAEVAAALIRSRFGISGTLVRTRATGEREPADAMSANAGEWHARSRRVRIERISTVTPAPPSARDPEDPVPVAPQPAPTLVPAADVKTISLEFRVPPEGTFSAGGWVHWFAKGTGEVGFRVLTPGSVSTVAVKPVIAPLKGFDVKVKAAIEAEIAEGLRWKLEYEFGGRQPGKPLPITAGLILGSWELVGSLKDLPAPIGVKFPKFRPVPYATTVGGVPVVVDVTFQGQINAWPGPKTLAKAGELATRASQYALSVARYATLVEGGAVGAGVAAPALVVTGGVLLFVGTIAATAQVVDSARERGDQRAQLVALRHGFAITVAAEVIGRDGVVRDFEKALDADYVRFIGPVQQAYARGKQLARNERDKLSDDQWTPWREAVKQTHGTDVIVAHNAILALLGGVGPGDADQDLNLRMIH